MGKPTVFEETLGHYNVLFKNKGTVIQTDIEGMMRKSSVFDLNEGTNFSAIREVVLDHHWQYSHAGNSLWLVWDPEVWKRRKFSGQAKISPGAKEYGLDIKMNPPRFMGWQCLQHLDSGERHDFYWAHLVAGYAKDSEHWAPKVARYKDHAARAGVLNIDRTTRRFLRARQDVHFQHLSGDFNSRQNNTEEPWYPANVLRDNWLPDTMPGSIDWMMNSVRAASNGLHVNKRWAEGDKPGPAGFDSDHHAHFKSVRFPAVKKK